MAHRDADLKGGGDHFIILRDWLEPTNAKFGLADMQDFSVFNDLVRNALSAQGR
ncbi:MAG: hypothetical protein Tsb002_02750 [Wenzhouxiangellaceae bacterium]